jgi:hypothetical protein
VLLYVVHEEVEVCEVMAPVIARLLVEGWHLEAGSSCNVREMC